MRCGTLKGWETHRTLNEPPCKWCAKYDPKLPQPKVTKPKPIPKPKTAKPRHRARVLGEITHGTVRGYQQHKARGDADCEPCRTAANAKRKALRDQQKAAAQ